MFSGVPCGHALLDGVLVRTGKGSEHEVTGVRVARVHRQLRAFLDRACDAVDIRKIEPRIDALRVEVQGERDQIDVSGALAVAEQAALDPFGAGHEREFGGGDGAAAVVMRVHAEDHAVAAGEMAMHPFNLVGVDVWRRYLDGRRQVEDHLASGRCAPGFGRRVADLTGIFEFGGRESLRAELERPFGFGAGSAEFADLVHGIDGH